MAGWLALSGDKRCVGQFNWVPVCLDCRLQILAVGILKNEPV
jgi:hypothetical protein